MTNNSPEMMNQLQNRKENVPGGQTGRNNDGAGMRRLRNMRENQQSARQGIPSPGQVTVKN
jgi:hypothetical protein